MSSRNVYDFSKAVVWLCTLFSSTINQHCWINQRRKYVVSLSWLWLVCAKYETQRKCLHKKRVQLPEDCFGSPTCLHAASLKVKIPYSCYLKSRAIQSRVREQNNCPNLGNKSTSSRIPTEKATFRPESYLMFCNTCMNENTLLVCTCFWWIHLFPPAARRQTQLTAQAKNVPGNFPILTY